MTHQLHDRADAEAVDAYFNGFHDGFIRSLLVRSRDAFIAYGDSRTDIAHEVTGTFDIAVDIAHYNYGQGTQPFGRVVRGTFINVGDVVIDLTPVRAEEWPITQLVFPVTATSGPFEGERFAFEITHGKREGEQWSTQTRRLFTFESAEFEELEEQLEQRTWGVPPPG